MRVSVKYYVIHLHKLRSIQHTNPSYKLATLDLLLGRVAEMAVGVDRYLSVSIRVLAYSVDGVGD